MTDNNLLIKNNILKATILLLSCYIMFGIVKGMENIKVTPWPIITFVLIIFIIIAYIFFVYWMKELAILFGKNKNLWIVLSVIFHVFALGYFIAIVLCGNQGKYILSKPIKDSDLTVVDLSCQHCGTVNRLESNTCSSCGRPIQEYAG